MVTTLNPRLVSHPLSPTSFHIFFLFRIDVWSCNCALVSSWTSTPPLSSHAVPHDNDETVPDGGDEEGPETRTPVEQRHDSDTKDNVQDSSSSKLGYRDADRALVDQDQPRTGRGRLREPPAGARTGRVHSGADVRAFRLVRARYSGNSGSRGGVHWHRVPLRRKLGVLPRLSSPPVPSSRHPLLGQPLQVPPPNPRPRHGVVRHCQLGWLAVLPLRLGYGRTHLLSALSSCNSTRPPPTRRTTE